MSFFQYLRILGRSEDIWPSKRSSGPAVAFLTGIKVAIIGSSSICLQIACRSCYFGRNGSVEIEMPTQIESSPIQRIEKTENGRSSDRFAWIDTLRGISALGVVLFHSRVHLYAGWNEIQAHPERYSVFERIGAYASLPLSMLGSGVMLFFILSGFCVHYPYSQASKRLNAGEYASRRFLRIYPPYLAAILLTVAAEVIAIRVSRGQLSSLGTTLGSVLMVQNYGSHPGQMIGNPSLWSLPVEIELYVAYPVFLYCLRRFGAMVSLMVVAAISIIASLAWALTGYSLNGNFLPYWVIWCAGAILAETASQRALIWRRWYGVVIAICLVASVLAELKIEVPMVKQYLWSGFFMGMIFYGISDAKLANWLTSRTGKILVSFGAVTYSLYLVHFPLFLIMGAWWTENFGSKSGSLVIPLLGSLLCLPFAFLFYRCIELPSHGLARRVGQKLRRPS